MLTLVLWQRVVILCVSRTVFRMSLVMVVLRMLCKEQYVLPEDDRVIETCRSVINSLM